MTDLQFTGFGISFQWHWGWFAVPSAQYFDYIFYVGPLQFLWVEV